MAREVTAGKDRDTHLLMKHKAPDSHHGGPSVVELDGALLQLDLVAERVPAEVEETIPVIPREFGLASRPVGLTVDDLGDDEEESHLKGDELTLLAPVLKLTPNGCCKMVSFQKRLGKVCRERNLQGQRRQRNHQECPRSQGSELRPQ